MERRLTRYSAWVLCAVVWGGCGDALESSEASGSDLQWATETVVDSILPIEEEIRRFKLTVDEAATSLSGGATTREELVAGFMSALERSDSAALGRAAVDRSEFIYLYFPHTIYTSPPYELDPAIVWFQMLNGSSRGITRAYNRFAGSDLGYRDHRCAQEPTIEGPNKIWKDCVVRFAPDGGEETETRLFGLILERDGHFKFVTYGNDL